MSRGRIATRNFNHSVNPEGSSRARGEKIDVETHFLENFNQLHDLAEKKIQKYRFFRWYESTLSSFIFFFFKETILWDLKKHGICAMIFRTDPAIYFLSKYRDVFFFGMEGTRGILEDK